MFQRGFLLLKQRVVRLLAAQKGQLVSVLVCSFQGFARADQTMSGWFQDGCSGEHLVTDFYTDFAIRQCAYKYSLYQY